MDVLPSGTGIALGNAGGAWQNTLDLTKISNLFGLYQSKGDLTVSGATNLPSTLDGPIAAYRYNTLTVNAALSVANRCRGLLLMCDTLVVGAAGSISMTARGAVGNSAWANQDILVPINVKLSGQKTGFRDFVAWCSANNYAIFDPTLYACPVPGMGDVQANYAAWPGTAPAIISAAGCGGGLFGSNGNAGSAGGTGSGGAGGSYSGYSGLSAPGRVWGGGPGSAGMGGCTFAPHSADLYGGIGGTSISSGGGGAGNPGGGGAGGGLTGGTGTGGPLIIICRGNITLTAGHSITSNGSQGGGGSANSGGGGSGAGSVFLSYGGALTGTPNLAATGGLGGAGSQTGGYAGGAGSAQVKTFAQMSWS